MSDNAKSWLLVVPRRELPSFYDLYWILQPQFPRLYLLLRVHLLLGQYWMNFVSFVLIPSKQKSNCGRNQMRSTIIMSPKNRAGAIKSAKQRKPHTQLPGILLKIRQHAGYLQLFYMRTLWFVFTFGINNVTDEKFMFIFLFDIKYEKLTWCIWVVFWEKIKVVHYWI